MTPPLRIQNFFSGSVYPIREEAAETPPQSGADELVTAFVTRDEANEAALANAQSRFLLYQGSHYGNEILRPVDARIPTEDLETRFPSLMDEARGGNRPAYFAALRTSYNLLDRLPPERQPEILRQFLGVLQEYLNFLDASSELSESERLRYIFATSRVTQAALAWVRSHAPSILSSTSEDWPALFEEALRQTDARWQDRYLTVDRAATEPVENLGGIAGEVELRDSILSGDRALQRYWAQRIENYYSEFPPADDDTSWPAYQGRILLRDPDFFSSLEPFDQSSPAEGASLTLNALTGDLLLTAGAALDQIQGENEAAIVSRYRAFSAVFTGLTWILNASTAAELLEQLADPEELSENAQLMAEARRAYPELEVVLTEIGTGPETEAFLREAQEAAAHLLDLSEGPGRAVFAPILQANARNHPLHQLAEALNPPPSWVEELGLAFAGSPLPSIHVAQARELFRGGERVLAFLAEREASDPQARRALQILNANSFGDPALAAMLEEILEAAGNILDDGSDHEMGCVRALLQTLADNHENYAQLGVPAAIFRRSETIVERMDGFWFRARQVGRHLTSTSNLASVFIGVLISELFPTLLILRAGAGGRWTLPLIGDLVRAGRLTGPGSAVVGITTGLGLSAVGSGLHNWERARLGLATDTAGDALRGGLLNAVTFGLTLPFSRWLGNSMSRRTFLRTGSYELSGLQNFGLHATTVGFAGLTSMLGGSAWRAAETGHFYTTPEEIAENAGTILMWETLAAGFRFGRRAFGVSAELNGLHTNQPNLGRAARLWRGFRRMAWTTVGPHRLSLSRTLAEGMVQRNPNWQGMESRLETHLVWEDSGRPGTLETYSEALRRGHQPVSFGFGANRRPGWLHRASFRFSEPPPAELPAGENPALAPPAETRLASEETPAALPASGTPEEVSHPILEIPAEEGSPAPLTVPEVSLDITLTASSAEETRLQGYPAADRHFFRVTGDENLNEGFLVLRDPEADPHGDEIYSITRGHFPFLPAAVRRVISRRHFELRRNRSNGSWTIRDLSRDLSPRTVPGEPAVDIRGGDYGTWLYTQQEPGAAHQWNLLNPAELGRPIRAGDWLLLGRRDEGVHLEFRSPIVENTPPGSPTTTSTFTSEGTIASPTSSGNGPTRVSLAPGNWQKINGLILSRGREGSFFRLGGPGETRLEIFRPQAERASDRQRSTTAAENPILGEIGEHVGVRITERSGETRDYHIILDDPEGRGSRIPEVALEYDGQSWTRAFRPSSPALNFGKLYDSVFASRAWISRQHFILEIVESLGNPRYVLTSQSRFGVRITMPGSAGELLPQGARAELTAGTYRLEFRQRSDAEIYDKPVTLTLPRMEVEFPEWRLNLAPEHDQAIISPPSPNLPAPRSEESPSLADRLEPDTSGPSTATLRILLDLRPWWERYWDMFWNMFGR